MRRRLGQVLGSLSLNATSVIFRWREKQGASDPNVEADYSENPLNEMVLPALVHFFGSKTEELTGGEIEAGDAVLTLNEDAPLDGRDVQEFVIGGRVFVQKSVGREIASEWDILMGGRRFARTIFCRQKGAGGRVAAPRVVLNHVNSQGARTTLANYDGTCAWVPVSGHASLGGVTLSGGMLTFHLGSVAVATAGPDGVSAVHFSSTLATGAPRLEITCDGVAVATMAADGTFAAQDLVAGRPGFGADFFSGGEWIMAVEAGGITAKAFHEVS